MKSAGTKKGFKCVNCGHKDASIQKDRTYTSRNLEPGIHLPRTSARRHLTRQGSRLRKRNEPLNGIIAKWHIP